MTSDNIYSVSKYAYTKRYYMDLDAAYAEEYA